MELTGEADSARAVVSAGHVLAGATVHAGVGLALVVVDVTVGAAPAGVAGALVASAKGKGGVERVSFGGELSAARRSSMLSGALTR